MLRLPSTIMEIIVTVPYDRVGFALEAIRSFTFVQSVRVKRPAKIKKAEPDTAK